MLKALVRVEDPRREPGAGDMVLDSRLQSLEVLLGLIFGEAFDRERFDGRF